MPALGSERIVASLDAIEAGLPCGQASLMVFGPHAATGTSGGMIGGAADVGSLGAAGGPDGPLSGDCGGGGGWVFCSTSGAAAAMHPLCAPHHAGWMATLRDSLHFCKEASAMAAAAETAMPGNDTAAAAAGAAPAAVRERAVVVAYRLSDMQQQHSNLMVLAPAAPALAAAAVAAVAAPIVTVRPLPLSLAPAELLALPVFHMRGGRERLTAVLLLSGLQCGSSSGTLDAGEAVAAAAEPQQQPAAAAAAVAQRRVVSGPPHQQQLKLGLNDYRELQRLSQFVGFGLFADPSHSAFLSQVAAQLAAVAGSHGLHDAIVAVLDTVPELIRSRTSVLGRPLLAACTAPLPPPTPASQHPPGITGAAVAGGGTGGGTGTVMVGGGSAAGGSAAAAAAAAAVAQGAASAQQHSDLVAMTAAASGAGGGAQATDGGPTSFSTSGAAGSNPVVVFAHRSRTAVGQAGYQQDANHPGATANNAGVIGGSGGANTSLLHSASASNLPPVNQSLLGRLPNSPLGGGGGGGGLDSGAPSRLQRVHSMGCMRGVVGDGDGGTGVSGGGAASSSRTLAAAPEPSRIKAVRMQLPRSLLLKAIKASGGPQQAQQASQPMPAGTNLSSLRRQPPGVHITSLSSMLGQVQQHQHQQQLLVGRRPTGISSVSVGTHNSTSGAVAAAFGGGAMSTGSAFASVSGGGLRHTHPQLSALSLATGRSPASTLTLSDASAHVLEDHHALRDVLLAGNLLGGVSPGAVVLCVEGAPLPRGTLHNAAALLASSSLAAACGAAGVSGCSTGTATIGGTSAAGMQSSHTGTVSSACGGNGMSAAASSALMTAHSVPGQQHAAPGPMPSFVNSPPAPGVASAAGTGSMFGHPSWFPPSATPGDVDGVAAPAAAGMGPAQSSGAAAAGNLGDAAGSQVLSKPAAGVGSAAVASAADAAPHGGPQNRPTLLSALDSVAMSYSGGGGGGSGGGGGLASQGASSLMAMAGSTRLLATAGMPMVTAPAPGRLALYLVFAETLPAGVLQMVEAELKQLMPMVFACFRAVLSGGNFSPVPAMPYGTPLVTLAQPQYSRVPSDWRLLYEQVTGRTVPLPSLAMTFSGAGAGAGGGGMGSAAGVLSGAAAGGGALLSRMISGLETVSEIDSQLLDRMQQMQTQIPNQQQQTGFGSIMSLCAGNQGQLAAIAAATMAGGGVARDAPGGAAAAAAGPAALYAIDNLRSILTPPPSPMRSLGGGAGMAARRPHLLSSSPAISGATGGEPAPAGSASAGGAAGGMLGGSNLLSSPRGTAAGGAVRQASGAIKSHGGPQPGGDVGSSSGGGSGGGTASLAAALKRRLTERSGSDGAFKALLGLVASGQGAGRGQISSGSMSGSAAAGAAASVSARLQLPGVTGGGAGSVAGFVSGLNLYGVGGGGVCGGVGLFGVGQLDTAPVDSLLEVSKAGCANAANWLYNSSPEVQLEEALQAAAAATASGSMPRASAAMLAAQQQQNTELLVSTVRSRLTAALAGSEDTEQARAALHQDLEAIELLDVLGRGGQGVVFRGTMHGLEAAIKVFAQNQAVAASQAGQDKQAAALKAKEQERQKERDMNDPLADSSEGEVHTAGAEAAEGLVRQAKRSAMEVAVSQSISHPNIVQVYAAFSGVVVVRCHYRDSPLPVLRLCAPDDAMLGNSDPGPLNQVLCLEYCDVGTLLAASRSGAFRQPCATGPANGAIWPALVPLYTSLLEVALALRHLHSRRLVHCDVKAANVLLKSSTRDPRGWTCKLSDFGCVRLMKDAGPDGALGFRVTHPLGTVGHMAPECFVKGALLGAAVDVYALGVMMYELLMCRTPYSNMNPQDVPRQVLRSGVRPVFHPLAPAPYVSLAARCWSASPRRRPTASELVTALQGLLVEAQAAAADAAAGSAGAGGGRAAAGTAARAQQPAAPAAAPPAAPAPAAMPAAPLPGRVGAPAPAGPVAVGPAAGSAAPHQPVQQSRAAPAAVKAAAGPALATPPHGGARGPVPLQQAAPPAAATPETVSVKRLEQQQQLLRQTRQP
ncbi:hypothetical protein CHLRE_17g709900v5 [Chlamydomonas reinhardtii]|uniref:Protein kinase domain-containing protein n=1 Tax=Chlamydomonas reinhardtii TaxID=3055 RepID=A0A2K3CPI6_CHLRE|nr:uncharacterized protein CHLRE_17g709900v5 [Chlamydomonas reinhardtii]PNW70197.1 hypothetical protein CHLRE_17g709900v5 [Chlamydomonas reinhardtii]